MVVAMDQLMPLLASVVLGIALAASCGLRAFLPLFALGVAARLGFVDLGEAFAWLSHTPALVALTVGVICELLGDKIPFVNHVLDVIATPARAIAGMLVFAATVVDMPVWMVAILAIIVGGGVALAVHVAKSGIRATSTVATAGASSPAHSLVEDAVCAAATILSFIFFGVALLICAAAVFLFVISVRALMERWKRPTAD
jgi:hypothetical protein